MIKRTKWIGVFAVAGLIAIGLAVLFFQGPAGKSTDNQTVKIGSFSVAIDYAPYLIAREKGWIDEALSLSGFTVEYTTFQSLPPINEAFATGDIDVVFEAEPPAIIGRAAGINLRIAGISTSLTQEVIVPMDSSATSIGDLKGKKIAVLAGSSSHHGVIKIMEQGGLKRGDIDIIDMAPPNAKAAFESGAVDAWAVWPPWVEQEIIAKKARVLKGANAYVHSLMVVRGPFATEHANLVLKLQGVIERAKTWIRANPEEAQETVAKVLDIPVAVVTLAWPKHDWNATMNPSVLVDIQEKATFLANEGFVKSEVNINDDLLLPAMKQE